MITSAITSLTHSSNMLLKQPAKFAAIVFSLCIVIASIILYRPVFYWLTVKMSLANGYLHIVALLGLIALGIYRLSTLKHHPFHLPVVFHIGALLWIPASILYVLNEAFVDFHTLSGALFIVYLYGLSGHFIKRALWQSMLLPVLLTILVLPFEHYLDIYLGFPLRLLSAEWAASVLHFTKLPLVTVESILVVDNKAAIVDLDCSGINSLWIGMIFYLLLTWIERYAINLRWAAIGFGLMLMLVIANVFRIVILVVLDLVLDAPKVAQLFHQSLGLLGFVISCLVVWWVLQRFASRSVINNEQASSASQSSHVWHAPLLILTIILSFILLYQPYQQSALASTSHLLQLDTQYPFEPTQLSPQEEAFFVSNDALAQKYLVSQTIEGKAIKASMVLVWSRAWKPHHVPENCYISQGYSISDQGLWQLNQQHNVRYLSLTKLSQQQTGVYWFQSVDRSTPDYSSRVLDSFVHPEREWVMVSILWEQPVNAKETTQFITNLKRQLYENQ